MQQCPSLCLANGPDVNKGGGGIFRVTSSVPRPEEERAALIRVVTARVQDNKNTLPCGSRAEDRDRRPSSRFSRPGKIRIRTNNSNDDGSLRNRINRIKGEGGESRERPKNRYVTYVYKVVVEHRSSRGTGGPERRSYLASEFT